MDTADAELDQAILSVAQWRWQKVAKDTALDRPAIRAWAERLNPKIQFAVTRARSA